MDISNNIRLGVWGERQAESFLESKGFQVVQRNFHVREGEVDLIMLDEGEIVFVEVKTRTSTNYGSPEESITKAKLDRIVQAAHIFLEKEEQLADEWRIDVVAIECSSTRKILRMEHYVNVGMDL